MRRAKQGAAARWSDDVVRFAIDEGDVQFGDLTFRCAVLDDEARVINGTEFMRVMGIYRSGALSTRRSDDDEIYFPLHLAFKNLRPFILEDHDLVDALREPIRYRSVKGSIAEGIPAQVLRRICSVWVRARAAGVLGASQRNVADKAETLLNALADLAIIALIDEATGYQKRRAHNELQKILSAYISAELLPWQRRFPISYYEQIYRSARSLQEARCLGRLFFAFRQRFAKLLCGGPQRVGVNFLAEILFQNATNEVFRSL